MKRQIIVKCSPVVAAAQAGRDDERVQGHCQYLPGLTVSNCVNSPVVLKKHQHDVDYRIPNALFLFVNID
jgi:hypothetical protein